MDFDEKIVFWYRKNKRDLPWRMTRDPFRIWLSEVILQQTRVQQGLPYYFSFIKKFPTVKKLALAPEEDVLKLWQGLGYYSRARNLHAAAKSILADFGGKFPASYNDLKKLKGIGDYTASAISSFCYNEVQPVVDGNVYRVLARIFGIATPIDSTQGKKEFRELATELISKNNPGEFNQAIMEFGALQCVPKNPNCEVCPFVQYCVARKKKLINTLPVKAKKTKVTDRYFYYLVMRHKGNVYLKKRTEKDIWKNLHDFPLIETKQKLTEKKLMLTDDWKKIIQDSPKESLRTRFKIQNYSREKKHILSHQRLHARFIEIELSQKLKGKKEWLYIKEKDLKKYAVPVLIEHYINKL